jgi:Rod binding domain-containing protein
MAVSLDFSPQNLSLLRSQEAVAPAAPQPANTTNETSPNAVSRGKTFAERGAHLRSPQDRKRAEAVQSAQDFESMFLEMMMKSMRQTALPEDASNAMDIYTGLLDSEYAKSMSGNGGVGVQQSILEWMKALDPDLAKPTGELAQSAQKANGTVEKALRNFRMQQYQNQAMLPLAAGKLDGFE